MNEIPNSQQSHPVETFQVSTMKNDLVVMQKTIDKLRNNFELVVTDIPSQLSQKISIIKGKQKSVASLVENERFNSNQQRYHALNTRINTLQQRVNKFVDTQEKRSNDTRFDKAYKYVRETVTQKTNEIRTKIAEDAKIRIESYKNKNKSVESTDKFEFHSSLQPLPSERETYSSVYQEQIDNTPLVSYLNNTQNRIDKALENWKIINERNQKLKSLTVQIDDDLYNKIESNHQEIVDLEESCTNLQADLKNKSKSSVSDVIEKKKTKDVAQIVTNSEFSQWVANTSHNLANVSNDLKIYINKCDTSLNGVQERIGLLSKEIQDVYDRIILIDKAMNDYNDQLSGKVDQKIEIHESSKKVDFNEVNKVFLEFKQEHINARNKIRKQIDETKMKLSEVEELLLQNPYI
ncbi:hypothetical protein TVAG_156660 [Trichomonas vaginalis G3]|uniref:Uncharacterized protein n=1 Tax=Trichomonas vaginalis (strain ATCC PRA-98 / G3) TaxID=412133 RepID=A2FRT8_TRIV3|nr:hypothetical protein TVAGG3_0104600 [Trichomonas vaginalis G3]EAX92387.1 hypothetical protein TVAG_156660 [Trichomonas vaginalis G3]KAI5544562.1 hypothetical protein TVAGG3_0104600 [Trichomonas vaginalis G3]|eukprot:XP_001305317.1 hypothetical protein [Trichomonas vaginalis G3]